MNYMRSIYTKGADVLTITFEDCTGRKLGKYRASLQDEEEIAKLFQSLIDKYSLNLKVIKELNVNNKTWLDDDEEFKL